MKRFSRLNMYRNSTGTLQYNCETGVAHSYGWYELLKTVNGTTILNVYNYSQTTIKHVHAIRSLARELGITIDLEVKAPQGLQDLETAIEHHRTLARVLELEVLKPRSRKSTNERRRADIAEHKMIIATLQELQSKAA